MHWLTKIALKKRWLTLLIAALVTTGSILAVLNLKMELIPDIKLPMTTVFALCPDLSQDKVAKEVSGPIEDEVLGMEGVKHVTSTSAAFQDPETGEWMGISLVFAHFDYGTDMDKVNSAIEQKLNELPLPPGVQPQLTPLDLSMMPVVTFSLTGVEGVNSPELTEIIDTVLELEDVAGVERVEVAGAIKDRETGEWKLSGDVYIRTNGEDSLSISAFKKPDANTVDVANAVVDKAGEINGKLSAGGSPQLLTVFDQSEYIERGISDLTRSGLIGAALAIIVIFLLLMAWRASLITAISIPLSILIGFLIMYLAGITINLLTLSAMAIAVGRVIDDSIVLLEVIYRRRQQGESFKEAAINGAKEVATPITSATIATVAIFIPLMFVGGIVGELFLPFALTITFAMLASLVVALTVVPALSGFITVKRPKNPKKSHGEKEPWYQRAYTPVLKWSLKHRAATLGIVGALFFGSFALLPVIGTSFLPEMTENMVIAEIEMPVGTQLEETDAIAERVEGHVEELNGVKIYQTTVGVPQTLSGALALAEGAGPNTATIMVTLESDADMEGAAETLRSACAGDDDIPHGVLTIRTGQAMMEEMGPKALEVSFMGEGETYSDNPAIRDATDELGDKLEGMGSLENIGIEPEEYEGNPLFIRHYDGKLSVRLTATITEEDVGAVTRDVEDKIDSILSNPEYSGVDAEMGGVAEQMEESFSAMKIAIIVAIAIAYVVMVLFMRSFINPLIIMTSLPLAFIGAFLGLLITGRPLGISSMMGILMLVGIVLTNAIVLITLVEQLRKGGMSTYDALVEGGRIRLRPILMTALTTMLALFPLALGLEESTLLAAELGTVVIGGLFSATLLTLVVIPVIYSLVDGLRHRIRRRRA
jgi:HAE1 family hydrophobic/amphiphilic exporter-1